MCSRLLQLVYYFTARREHRVQALMSTLLARTDLLPWVVHDDLVLTYMPLLFPPRKTSD